MVPKGWQEVRLGDLFESRRERGRPGLPTTSVTLYDGLVPRHSLDRKTETNLAAEEHLLVREGDIAYNMMRMWQGASGLAMCDAIVSPAYVVLKPTSLIDPLFASYFFKAPRTIYLFWAYSYGLTRDRLRLYFPDFSLIPVLIPPIEEQRRIGQLLQTWDHAIETVKLLIDNSKRQKAALSRELLSSRERSKTSKFKLADIAKIVVSNVDKKSDPNEATVRLCNYKDVYDNDYITNNIDFMPATAGQAEIEKFSLKRGDILITKDSETPDDIAVPAIVDDDLDDVVCGYHLAIVRPFQEVDSDYLHALFSQKSIQHYFFTRANGATRFGLTLDAISDSEFLLPSLSQQDAVAKIIRLAASTVQAYEDKLALLLEEKAALMQQLFGGIRRVRVDEAVESAYA